MPGVESKALPRGRRWGMAALAAVALAVLTAPFTLLSLGFWATEDSWEFTGHGVRHWFFVKGSTVDRLGFVAATGTTPRYVVRLEEGTDPGAIRAVFDSDALPEEVVDAYAQRCRALGIAVKKRAFAAERGEARLVCEAEAAGAVPDDVFVSAVRVPKSTYTQVGVTAGPGLAATYDF